LGKEESEETVPPEFRLQRREFDGHQAPNDGRWARKRLERSRKKPLTCKEKSAQRVTERKRDERWLCREGVELLVDVFGVSQAATEETVYRTGRAGLRVQKGKGYFQRRRIRGICRSRSIREEKKHEKSGECRGELGFKKAFWLE